VIDSKHTSPERNNLERRIKTTPTRWSNRHSPAGNTEKINGNSSGNKFRLI